VSHRFFTTLRRAANQPPAKQSMHTSKASNLLLVPQDSVIGTWVFNERGLSHPPSLPSKFRRPTTSTILTREGSVTLTLSSVVVISSPSQCSLSPKGDLIIIMGMAILQIRRFCTADDSDKLLQPSSRTSRWIRRKHTLSDSAIRNETSSEHSTLYSRRIPELCRSSRRNDRHAGLWCAVYN
jgi:hypothetical protein